MTEYWLMVEITRKGNRPKPVCSDSVCADTPRRFERWRDYRQRIDRISIQIRRRVGNKPVILLGDFNRQQGLFGPLRSLSYRRESGSEQGTFIRGSKRLDRILVGNMSRKALCTIHRNSALDGCSDHWPVSADIRIEVTSYKPRPPHVTKRNIEKELGEALKNDDRWDNVNSLSGVQSLARALSNELGLFQDPKPRGHRPQWLLTLRRWRRVLWARRREFRRWCQSHPIGHDDERKRRKADLQARRNRIRKCEAQEGYIHSLDELYPETHL